MVDYSLVRLLDSHPAGHFCHARFSYYIIDKDAVEHKYNVASGVRDGVKSPMPLS